jgi:hypothetical protein
MLGEILRDRPQNDVRDFAMLSGAEASGRCISTVAMLGKILRDRPQNGVSDIAMLSGAEASGRCISTVAMP